MGYAGADKADARLQIQQMRFKRSIKVKRKRNRQAIGQQGAEREVQARNDWVRRGGREV